MSTNFAYVTHRTPRIPLRDMTTKRVYKDRPVHDYVEQSETGWDLLAVRRIRESRHLAAFLGDCGQRSCQVCDCRR